MRGTLIATCLQVVHSSAKALGPSGQCCPRKGERLQIFITDALKGIIAMEVVSAHIISRAGVADPSQADRGELALRKGEDVLGRTPTPLWLGLGMMAPAVPTCNSPRVWPLAPGRHQVSPAGTAWSGNDTCHPRPHCSSVPLPLSHC